MPRDLNYTKKKEGCCQCGGHCHDSEPKLAGFAIVHVQEEGAYESLKARLAELRETIVSAYNEVTDICDALGIDDDDDEPF